MAVAGWQSPAEQETVCVRAGEEGAERKRLRGRQPRMGYSPGVGGVVQSEHGRQEKGELSLHGSVEQTRSRPDWQPHWVSDTAEQFFRVTWKAGGEGECRNVGTRMCQGY